MCVGDGGWKQVPATGTAEDTKVRLGTNVKRKREIDEPTEEDADVDPERR